MHLTSAQKQHVFQALNNHTETELTSLLINAVKESTTIPVIGKESPLKELIAAYDACKELPEIQKSQLKIIRKHINDTAIIKFKAALSEPFSEQNWPNSDFLTLAATTFSINLNPEPMVVLTISEGKVYWKITRQETELYTNHSDTASLHEQKRTITMTWQQFRKFKDAGKRASSVSINKDRFYQGYRRSNPNVHKTVTDQIWQCLKDKKFLDKNNRLSHLWLTSCGEVELTLRQFNYTYISDALNRVSITPGYSHEISPGCVIFRPARSFKTWSSNAKITNSTPKSEDCKTRKLDVSNHKDLTAHSQPDKLDIEHIPTSVWMRDFQDKEISQGRHNPAHKEESKDWGCIAIEDALHHSGITHGKGKREQLAIEKPFYEDVKDYLEKEESKAPDDFLEVLGAFRYLYRCQVTQKFTNISNGFFANKAPLKENIDDLFLDKLEATVSRL